MVLIFDGPNSGILLISLLHAFQFQAALNMFTKTLSIELKTLGILVVAMHPGWVKTDMGGSKAPVSTQESVSGMLKVLPTLTKYNTGRLFEYTGREMPW